LRKKKKNKGINYELSLDYEAFYKMELENMVIM